MLSLCVALIISELSILAKPQPLGWLPLGLFFSPLLVAHVGWFNEAYEDFRNFVTTFDFLLPDTKTLFRRLGFVKNVAIQLISKVVS